MFFFVFFFFFLFFFGGGRATDQVFCVDSLKRSTILAPFTVSLLQISISNLNVRHKDSLKVKKQYIYLSVQSGDSISLFNYEK